MNYGVGIRQSSIYKLQLDTPIILALGHGRE